MCFNIYQIPLVSLYAYYKLSYYEPAHIIRSKWLPSLPLQSKIKTEMQSNM